MKQKIKTRYCVREDCNKKAYAFISPDMHLCRAHFNKQMEMD